MNIFETDTVDDAAALTRRLRNRGFTAGWNGTTIETNAPNPEWHYEQRIKAPSWHAWVSSFCSW